MFDNLDMSHQILSYGLKFFFFSFSIFSAIYNFMH